MIKPYYQEKDIVIYCGDCLETMPELPDKAVDMILADLPYGTTACNWDTVIPFEPLWTQYKRLIKDNGAIVLTASQPFTSALVMSNLEMFKYEWVWDKKTSIGHLFANKKPMRGHENICIFYKKQPPYNPIKTLGKTYKRPKPSKCWNGMQEFKKTETVSNGMRFPRTLIEISNADQTERKHPTQKPVALFEYLIRTYTNEEDTVLDNVMGSGTTLVAAKQLGRKSIGIEIEEKYCEIAVRRLSQEPIQFKA